MTPAQLIKIWIDLFRTRADLSFKVEPSVQPVQAPREFPASLQALAAEAGLISLAYAHAGDSSKTGSLFLDLRGAPAELEWLVVDGQELASDQLDSFRELDLDGLGTGQAGWLWLRADGAARVVFSLENPVVFDSVEEYLRAGARAGFSFGWQWGYRSALDEVSLSRSSSPAEVERALVARGASIEDARAMLEWLGSDAALLVPAAPAPQQVAKPPAEPPTLLAYRPQELPAELLARFPLTDDVSRCLFWVTKGGSQPGIDRLFQEVPEPSIEGVEAGMELMKVVSRIAATSTETHIALRANGSIGSGFHSGNAAEVERWLRASGANVQPLRPFLEKVLVVAVKGASADQGWLKRTPLGQSYADEISAVTLGLFAFDRDDSQTAHFTLQRMDGTGSTAEIRAADVPPGHVVTVEL